MNEGIDETRATGGTRLAADVRLAVAFLTRLPVGRFVDQRPLSVAVWAFPVAGALVGLAGAGVLYAAAWAQLHPLACAVLALVAMVLVSGALHEDGLADVADGFGASAERARKLDVMRDSRIGAYGVLALVLSVLVRAALLAGFHGAGTAALAALAAATGSRAVMGVLMAGLPHARADGLGKGAGKPAPFGVAVAVALGVAAVAGIGVTAFGVTAALAALVGATVGAGAMAWLAARQIGGQTGDVLGAAAQLAEIGILIGLAGSRWTHM